MSSRKHARVDYPQKRRFDSSEIEREIKFGIGAFIVAVSALILVFVCDEQHVKTTQLAQKPAMEQTSAVQKEKNEKLLWEIKTADQLRDLEVRRMTWNKNRLYAINHPAPLFNRNPFEEIENRQKRLVGQKVAVSVELLWKRLS